MLNIKSSFYFLFIILFFFSCTNSKPKETTTPKEPVYERWPFEDIPEELDIMPLIRFSHRMNLIGQTDKIPVRKRALTKSELSFSNSASDLAKSFNDSTIITYIYNSELIELIEETESYYFIKFNFKSNPIEGYIIKTYDGKPTLIKDKTDAYLLKNNVIENPDLLPYCRVFITEKFHKLLIEGKNSKDKPKYLYKILENTPTELLLYSIFIGESERKVYFPIDVVTSDAAVATYAVKNKYYVYDFFNYISMFGYIEPYVPIKVDSFTAHNDTLRLSADNYNDQMINKSYYKLYPVDSKRAFTSKKFNRWVLNDTIGLLDISYLADKLNVPESQIGHLYFHTILDLYIQEIWPKRKEGYLIHMLD